MWQMEIAQALAALSHWSGNCFRNFKGKLLTHTHTHTKKNAIFVAVFLIRSALGASGLCQQLPLSCTLSMMKTNPSTMEIGLKLDRFRCPKKNKKQTRVRAWWYNLSNQPLVQGHFQQLPLWLSFSSTVLRLSQIPCYAHHLIKTQQMHLPAFNLQDAEQIGLDKKTFPDRQSHLITTVY